MTTKLGDLKVSVSADVSGLNSGFSAALTRMGQFSAAMRNQSRSLAREVFSFAAGDLAAGGFRGVTTQIRSTVAESIKLAASWERSATAFEVLLGSAGRAADLMRELRSFAADSPLALSDAVTETRKLLAAGITQDQIVPTLEMLSDVTMGDRSLFSRASLAYSQARAAGVLQGDELRQLNELGVPIMDALAQAMNVQKSQVKGMISSGKVEFRDLQQALKNLTTEGGLFYQMTRKGAATTEGMLAKLGDAVEDLQREFGRAVIEESGLNEALADGASFAEQMKRSVDDIRPGIRLASDLAKGTAQLAGELLRNGPLAFAAFSDGIRQANPRLARMLDLLSESVTRLQDLRADPHLFVDIGLDMAESFTIAFGGMFEELGGHADEFFKKHIKPTTDAITSAAQVWNAMAKGVKGVADLVNTATSSTQGGQPLANPLPARREALAEMLVGYHASLAREKGNLSAAEMARRADLLHQAAEALDAANRLPNARIPNPLKYAPVDERWRQRQFHTPSQQELTAAVDAAERLIRGLPSFGGPGDAAGGAQGAVTQPSVFDRIRAEWHSRAEQMRLRNMPSAMIDMSRGALLGGIGLARESNRRAFEIDPPFSLTPTALQGATETRLAPAAELGSQAVAEAFARSMAGGGPENETVRAVKALTDVEREALKLLTGIAASLAQPAPQIAMPPR